MSQPLFHPAASLLVWLFFMVLLSQPYWSLGVLLGLTLVLSCCWPQLCWQMWRRLRWLLLALLLLSGWTVAGLPLWPVPWSPSWAGLQLGGQQALRLLLMALTLRYVWQLYGQAGFMAGLCCLLQPGRCLGLPVARFALLLTLTLAYAEQLLAARPRLSLAWLQQQLAQQGSQTVPDKVELGFYAWQCRDGVLVCVAGVLFTIIMKVVQ